MHYETIDGPRGNVVLRLKLGMGAQFHVCWGKQSRRIGVCWIRKLRGIGNWYLWVASTPPMVREGTNRGVRPFRSVSV